MIDSAFFEKHSKEDNMSELEPKDLVRVRFITFNQDEEDGERAIVEFEIMDGQEDEEPLSMGEWVSCPASCEDFDRIIRDAAKALRTRLLRATANLSQQYGL